MAATHQLSKSDWVAPARAKPGLARLGLLALGFLALAMAAGMAAFALFSAARAERLDRELADAVRQVQAATVVRNGRVVTAWADDPESLRAYSGVYWQVAKPAPEPPAEPLGLTPLATSRSLWDATLPPPPPADLRGKASGQPGFYDAPGPMDQQLRIAFVQGRAADGSTAVYLAARDVAGVRGEALAFAAKVTGALGLLGLGLLALAIRRKPA